MHPVLDQLALSARTALSHLKPEDEVAVMVYSAGAQVIDRFTTDRTETATAISRAAAMDSRDAAFFNETSTPSRNRRPRSIPGRTPLGVSSVIAKRKADSRIVDSTETKGGKVIATSHAVVSADGKSIRLTAKGTDAQGKTFERVEVFDKQ